MFDKLRNFFSKSHKERVSNAREGPLLITGLGPTVKDHKCPNCKKILNVDTKVSTDPSFLKIFKYLVCSTCGYQKRIKI